jgi:adenylate cyclase
VIKERTLYLSGRTRIHFDRVEGLGDYMELEVVMEEWETDATGAAEAAALLARLGIPEEDRVEGAYLDLS